MENVVFDYFNKGGWVMWPILLTSLVSLAVTFERAVWWIIERRKRDTAKREQVFIAMEKGDMNVASGLSRTSEDPVLRVLWHGLNNHQGVSLESALQVGAGIEIERAGRFLVVLDTIVTLAPLLGLLGTVLGLMKAFFKLGTTQISAESISGGIAEALIATTCGLTIAIVSLVSLNFFASRLAKFQFELQIACTNAEIVFGTAMKKKELFNEGHISAAA